MIVPLSLSFESTLDFTALLNRQLNNSCVLPLENGNFHGRIQIIRLPNIVLNLIRSSKKISICADRSPSSITFAVDLAPSFLSPITAQGVTITRPSIFGFHSSLKDLDLSIDKHSLLCSVIVPLQYLSRILNNYDLSELPDFLDKYNILSSSSVRARLVPYLRALFSSSVSHAPSLVCGEAIETDIISLIIDCFIDDVGKNFDSAVTRKDRHQAALCVLSTATLNTGKPLEIQDLSELIHQSRTSIFNGCKEKFGMSPVEVVRSVRLHQARHALLDAEFCKKNNLNGVIDIANHFGFSSRSHFSRYYKKCFSESPRQSFSTRR